MSPTDVEPGVHRTHRWRWIEPATILAGALGLVARRPALLLVSALGLALVAYARVVPAPPLALAVTRTTEDADATPGERVRVQLSVTNVGDGTIPDLRLVDGVPEGLQVVDGEPGLGATVRPGATASTTYALEARAGTHRFGPALAVARDVAGVVERRDRIAVEDAGHLEARPVEPLDTVPPLRSQAARYAGQRSGDASGEGLAFHGVREYRRGDPPSRIDWDRLARVGDLATVEFREERSVSVAVAVDARPVAARASSPAQPTAAERGLTAATRLVDRLARAGHSVGVARLGDGRRWLAPGRDREHRRRARELLSERPPLDGTGDAPRPDWLRERLRGRSELFLVTPALDDAIVDFARAVHATGTPTTVLSPDPTDEATTGRTLARLERNHRLRSLRADGIRVLDWEAGTPLERAARRLEVVP